MEDDKKNNPAALTRALASRMPLQHEQVERVNRATESHPPVRGVDGRTLRRTNRDKAFNTNISHGLYDWLMAEKLRRRKAVGELFDIMRESYECMPPDLLDWVRSETERRKITGEELLKEMRQAYENRGNDQKKR